MPFFTPNLPRRRDSTCKPSPSPPPWAPGSSWIPPRSLNRLFAALRQKQFRYFLTGSFLSNVGSWMQSLALAWLILDLTHSPFYLGLEGFANTIPISVFAFW